MMDRRAFLAGIGALGAAASVRAQAPASPRIGWIAYTDPGIAQAAFQDGMRALGYSGTNAVRIEARVVAANPESTRAALEELQRLQVALIVAQGSTAPVVHRLNADHTPLLFAFSGDPVAAGMVASFGRPGGNTTKNIQGVLPDLSCTEHVDLIHDKILQTLNVNKRLRVVWRRNVRKLKNNVRKRNTNPLRCCPA